MRKLNWPRLIFVVLGGAFSGWCWVLLYRLVRSLF